jgi:hypothetical protein
MSKARKPTGKNAGLTFESLVICIRAIDNALAAQVARAVNISVTLRNWLIGCYIAEYELRGADRAQYGAKVLANLSAQLVGYGVSRAEATRPRGLGCS